jgi:hypothetical protein
VKAIRKVIADVLPELKARGHFELANEAMDLLEGRK